jgi:hypothetical protein
MKKIIRSIAVVLTTTLLLSSCGGSSDGPSTFVSHDQSGAMTISWTDDDNGNLAGSLQSTTPNPDGTGELVKTVNASFTGTLHDGQISIVTHGFLGDTSTWPGSLSGDTLILNIPQQDGSIARATFARGKVSDYNLAVSAFQDQVTQQRAKVASDAATAAAQAASASASAAAAAALADADKQVSDGGAALRGSLSSGLSFAAFDADMTTLNTDLATTRSDALKATTAGAAARANMDACGDASTAQGDASTVGGDESTIGGDASTAQATIDSVAQQVDSLRNAQTAMKATYQQQGLTPSVSEAPVLDLLSQADTAIKSWKTKVDDYVATAHQLATQATTTADAAASAVC